MSLIEVKVPDIGDFKEVEVIELLVKPGDTVTVDQSLITVESDKASMEIPSSHAGVVKELKVKLGDKVKEGSLVLLLEAQEAAAPAHVASARRHPLPPLRLLPHLHRACCTGSARLPALPARSTSNATCWCWAPAPAAIRRPSAPPISAWPPCWSSAIRRWAACA